MGDIVYGFFRAGCGFSLIVVGLGFFAERRTDRPRPALGTLFVGVGALFVFSFASSIIRFQQDIDIILLAALVFAISQAFYELCLFVMGGPRKRGWTKRTYIAGAVWTSALIVLPLIDYALGLEAGHVSVEDALPRQPLHAAATILVYLWPIAVTVAAFAQGRWKLADIPLAAAPLRHARLFVALAVPILSIIAVALIVGHRTLYRLGNIALQFYMVLMYLFLVRYPDELGAVRRAIGEEHRRRLTISDEEAALIAARLEKLVEDKRIYARPELDIGILAKELSIPTYRLSKYFSQHLSVRFPVWLNALRIEQVCRRMEGNPKRSILDLAMEAGYSSKTAFNKQFLELKGMSPSEYRKNRKDAG